MAISLTCVCGAILEIDDKFKGRKIPCPDCNRLIDTAPPPAPPKTTSPLALTGFILSVAGMFTIVGPIAGAVCSFLGYRQIRRNPTIGGLHFAKAGMGLGVLFTLLGVVALTSTEFFGLDGFLRLYVGARDLRYPTSLLVRSHAAENVVLMRRPSTAWGVRSATLTENVEDLTLIDLWDDAHIAVFHLPLGVDEAASADAVRNEVIANFLSRPLVRLLSKGKAPPEFQDASQIDAVHEEKAKSQLFRFHLKMGDLTRVFLVRLFEQGRFNVVVAGTRESRFDRLEESLRKAIESCEIVSDNDERLKDLK